MTADLSFPRFDGEAACAEVGGDEWFPEPGNPGRRSTHAIKICNRCEVIDECLKWALRNGEPFGIWGGLTEQQRRRLPGIRRAS